jgi:hypothetical protein
MTLANTAADIPTMPLPWPTPEISAREARQPHRHQCIACDDFYLCAGPELSGECAPVCAPCLWVELGAQLRSYQSMADTIQRRRRKIEQQFGLSICRRAQAHRRSLLRQRNVIAGFGQIVMMREQSQAEQSEESSGLLRFGNLGEGTESVIPSVNGGS